VIEHVGRSLGAQHEVARLKQLGTIARRPEQLDFSRKLREAYNGKCAVTGCATGEALEAAHIKVKKGFDDNHPTNGILLRADIHALFDAELITLTEDGTCVQVKKALLEDPVYRGLDRKAVFRPSSDAPSRENILHHRRECFGEE
jgi:predicted restriction endonuclease